MEITSNKTLIIGDIHGEVNQLNDLICKKKPDALIQCGDNAFFWKNHKLTDTSIEMNLNKVKPGKTKIYFILGNHEHWDYVEKKYGRHRLEPIEVKENVFYCPIGSSLIINELNYLFVGGAESIDKAMRQKDVNWFEQETLNEGDLKFILDNYKENDIDVIVSHTCPGEIFSCLSNEFKGNDPSYKILSKLLWHFSPSWWYFGHFHMFKKNYIELYEDDKKDKCYWTCLSTCSFADKTGWWVEL
ncbi:MAG: metallophosphoesterase family protein [Promethearchaeota archaeon]